MRSLTALVNECKMIGWKNRLLDDSSNNNNPIRKSEHLFENLQKTYGVRSRLFEYINLPIRRIFNTSGYTKHRISTRNSQNCSSTAKIYSRSESFQKLKFSKVHCSKKWDKVSNESTEHKLRK